MADSSELGRLAEQLQLGQIIAQAAKNFDWDPDTTQYAEEWYLKHWYIRQKYPDRPLAAISKSADDLWHQHLLDTKKYADDCERILGTFMHHQPIYGEASGLEKRAYDDTAQLYQAEFGTMPRDAKVTSGDYSYSPPLAEESRSH